MTGKILSIISTIILSGNIIGAITVIITNKFKSNKNKYGIGVLIASSILLVLVNLRWFA